MDLQVIQVKGFHPSQPNDHTSANCVTLWRQFHGYWDDEDCSRHYRFICARTEEQASRYWLPEDICDSKLKHLNKQEANKP